MPAMYSYYDPEADIAWLPTGDSVRVVSEEVEWGLIDHDEVTGEIVAVEIWAASERLPQAILDALPAPDKPRGVAA
jgi:uncharacterized protein YuzE